MRFLVVLSLLTGCKNDYAITREVVVDSFSQPGREDGVDILWVIDDSGSMYEEQGQLEAHAGSFIGYLSAVSVDFALGVTSADTSGDDPGALLGDVLSPDTTSLTDAFANQVARTDDGSRDERGFEAAILAADPAGINSDFNRSDADLEIIFFTDEDDGSAIAPGVLLDTLQTLREGQVVVNAIVGDPPSGCASIESAADAGLLYIEAQEQSGGLRESICSLDYETMLERVALRVLGLETTFYLRAVPDPASMEVLVDGAQIPARERHGWRYEAGLNAVVFDGYAVPQPGSDIVIRYYEWLGPAFEEEESDVEE